MPRGIGQHVTVLVRSASPYVGATLPMVDGLLVLPVPASRVIIIGGQGWFEEASVRADGHVVQSERRVHAYFFTSNRTRDPAIMKSLRRRANGLPAEFNFDRVSATARSRSAQGEPVLRLVQEAAERCSWVDRVLAAGNYN
jgi:hypothetical protein